MFWKRAVTPEIQANELAELIEQGRSPMIVDVRSPKEYAAGHLPGAINLPFEEITRRSGVPDPTALTVFY